MQGSRCNVFSQTYLNVGSDIQVTATIGKLLQLDSRSVGRRSRAHNASGAVVLCRRENTQKANKGDQVLKTVPNKHYEIMVNTPIRDKGSRSGGYNSITVEAQRGL